MTKGSRIFVPNRGLGHVSNHLPVQVRYIKSRKENLVITCVGKSFHTYGISHFGLLSVGSLHPEDITCLATDTYHVYTACDKTIYAWRRGTELKHEYRGHRRDVKLIMPFGAHLVSIDAGGGLRVWDIKDESVHLELTFSNNTFEITTLTHPSTYINKILLGSEQGELQLWNLNTAKMIYKFDGWGEAVRCVEQAPAVDVVAVGLASGRIVLHNLKFDETVMEFQQHCGGVTSISFRSDDSHPIMVTGSTSGNINLWDLEERRVAGQLLEAHDEAVTGVVCLSGEPLLLTSSPDNSLKLWVFDMPDGGARLLRIREGHSSVPNKARFHGSNGHNIISSAGDSTLRIFNTQTEQFNKSLGKASYNRNLLKKKKGRTKPEALIMPPIVNFTTETTREKEWDNIAAIHSGIPMVTLWSYDKLKMGERKLLPERLQKANKDHDADITATCLCLTHCGNFVLIGYSDGLVDRFNMQSGLWRLSYGEKKLSRFPIRGVAVDPLNQITIVGGNDGLVKFYPFKNGTKLLTQLNVEEPITFFKSHRESSLLAIALEDYSAVIVDIDTRTIIRKLVGHSAALTDATFSPDSRWLMTSSMDRSLRTWDLPSGQLVDQFKTHSACVSLDLSPTGEALITAHVDNLGLFLWCNKTIYQNVSLKSLDPSAEVPMVELPEFNTATEVIDEEDAAEDEFISPEQISADLITLSGLATSRWLNLLNLDVIKARNKPVSAPKAPKAAPFFLPTIPSLNLQFDLSDKTPAETHLITHASLINLTKFGRLLSTRKYTEVITELKNFGPSMLDFEVRSLAPEGGGSIDVMLYFFEAMEVMFRSNKDFELAQAYLALFLKLHGDVVANEDRLRNFLPSLQSCMSVAWNRVQENLVYNLCVVQMLKNQV